MLHIQHVNCMLAGRGIQAFMFGLFDSLTRLSQKSNAKKGSFDGLAAHMPLAFSRALKTVKKNTPFWVSRSIFDSQEIVLCGWSNEHNRMRAILYRNPSKHQDLEITEIQDPGMIIPWDSNWGEAPEGDDPWTMTRTAKLQLIAEIERRLAGGENIESVRTYLEAELTSGGDATATTPYIVSEVGPELFIPKQAGTVVPNNKLGGGDGMTIPPSYMINIDSRSDQAQVLQLVSNAVQKGVVSQFECNSLIHAIDRQ